MAERRMFAKTIIDSDAFLDMPISARLLYYDLAMRADDDGFVNSPKKIMRFIGASNDDMSILITRKFVIAFDNGVVVIKHWRIHNYIRKDTYNETPYIEQKSLLELDEKNAYTLKTDVRQLDVNEPSTQVRLGKDRLGKDSINKSPSLEEIQNYITEKNLKVDAQQFYDYFTEGDWIDSKGNKVKNWKQKLLTWNKYGTNIKTNKSFNNSNERTYDNLDYLYANKGGLKNE